jgi:hypothetical protein
MSTDAPFVIVPSERALGVLRSFDPSMREEVREHAAKIAADPEGELVRSPSAHGLHDRYEYR